MQAPLPGRKRTLGHVDLRRRGIRWGLTEDTAWTAVGVSQVTPYWIWATAGNEVCGWRGKLMDTELLGRGLDDRLVGWGMQVV